MDHQFAVKTTKINEEGAKNLRGTSVAGSVQERIGGFLASFMIGLMTGNCQFKIGAGIAIEQTDDERRYVPMVAVAATDQLHAFTTKEARVLVMSIHETIDQMDGENEFSEPFYALVEPIDNCIQVAEEKFTTWPEYKADMAIDLSEMQLSPKLQKKGERVRASADAIMAKLEAGSAPLH